VAEYGLPRVPHADLLARYGLQASDFAQFMRSLVAVRDDRHKLIIGSDGSLELYDLTADPMESVDRAGEQPNALAQLQGYLREWRAEMGLSPAEPVLSPRPAIAPEVAERLKALGYLD
jgi:hypothetical protein